MGTEGQRGHRANSCRYSPLTALRWIHPFTTLRMPEQARYSLVLAFSKRPMAANIAGPDLVRMRNLPAGLMTGYKRNR